MTLLQYAKSTDPTVIAAVESSRTGWQQKHDAAIEWALAQGSPDGGYFGGRVFGSFTVWALALPEKPKGWAVGPQGRGYRPRKGTALFDEMNALDWTPPKVPGLPAYFTSRDDSQGRSLLMSPTPFVVDGAAWVLLSRMPVEGEFGEEWVEVKASEAHAAREAKEAEDTDA